MVDVLDEDTKDENNHFTQADVFAALKMYHEDFVNFPREKIAETTGLLILPNKRNFRIQELHLRIARRTLEIMNQEKGKPLQGRPSKEEKVITYLQKHPEQNPTEIARALGVSRPTVYKYLKNGKAP